MRKNPISCKIWVLFIYIFISREICVDPQTLKAKNKIF